jgi:hypothetical protein
MIPLRDNIPARTAPIVTVALIAINLAIFAMSALLPQRELEAFVFRYGLIPARIFRPEIVASYYWNRLGLAVPFDYSLSESLLPLLTCMFLHGGVLHVVGNMWILWIFGDNVEDALGHFGFLLFYLGCGLASSLVQTIASPFSPVATIGASGAIAGVMGAYMALYPYARVMTFVWFFFYVDVWPIPAFLFLFYWFLIQFFSGMTTLSGDILAGGIAWWAHIGGFLAGLGFVLFSGLRPAHKAVRSYARRAYYFDPRTGRFVPVRSRSREETD